MQNSTSGPYVAPVFSPPPYAIAVNALFFASLGIVLVAAFLCMLVKGWIRELDRKLQGIPDLEKRAVIKELREQGLARWRLPEIIIILPSLIHISLFIFFIGLVLYLFHVHPLPAFLLISIFGLGVFVYFLSIVISAIDDFAPFRSMYSRALGVLYRRLYPRQMAPSAFHSLSVMALPQTTIEKIRERVSTFIIKYEPLSEQAIFEPPSPTLKKITSNTSISVFNKIWSPVSKREASADARNVATSILLQLDVTHVHPSQHRHFPLPWKSKSELSIKEAEGVAYSACMTHPTCASRLFVWGMPHVIAVLQRSPDPWPLLVASLTNVWVEDVERRQRIVPLPLCRPSIACRKDDILRAISNISTFSPEQWCFVLSSIYVLFLLDGRCLDSEEIRALTEILSKLLQKGLWHMNNKGVTRFPNAHTDYWLYVMISVLEKATPRTISAPKSSGEILHAQDIDVYGDGMTRDPKYIRRLLQLSRERNLNKSLMGKCLISILYILISFRPSTEQQIRLVDRYTEVIKEEMDMIDWSLYLSGLLHNGHNIQGFVMSEMVLCLLRGRYPHSPSYHYSKIHTAIIREYDLKLSAAFTQPTPSIQKVLDGVILPCGIVHPLSVPELELQNSWLSLYACNLTHSPHHSGIPFTWSPGCISIASRRLDLYDSSEVAPEMDLISSFLSCPSISTACRALRWYLRLKESALASSDTKHLTTVFPIIFRKYLSVDDNHMSWLLLVEVLLPSLKSMSPQGKKHVVETFFGYGSSGGSNHAEEDPTTLSSRAGDENVPGSVHLLAPMATVQPDGLGWMEDVWTTVLTGFVVHPDRVKTYWPGLLGVRHATYPEPARKTELTSPTPISPGVVQTKGTPNEIQAPLHHKIIERRLADSARCVLEVLAQLLEPGTGLMPAVLLNRVRNSPLLSDRRLDHDTSSLHRIRAILDQGVQS